MPRWNLRIWIGSFLIVLGALLLLERSGLFPGAVAFAWNLLVIAAGGYCLYRFARKPRTDWWAALPGFGLVGLGLAGLLPAAWHALTASVFLLLLGIGFFAIYIIERSRWWAIIPGGVLITLGIVSVLGSDFNPAASGAIFLLGLGLTFLLVAVLAALSWAYIPGVILLVIGIALALPLQGTFGVALPAVLIVAGLLLVVRFFRRTQ
jgi:hypothetical protein